MEFDKYLQGNPNYLLTSPPDTLLQRQLSKMRNHLEILLCCHTHPTVLGMRY